MAANTLASLKEQQHVEFEALTVFATDGHSCFCRYLGAVKGISSKHKFLIRVPVRWSIRETHSLKHGSFSVRSFSSLDIRQLFLNLNTYLYPYYELVFVWFKITWAATAQGSPWRAVKTVLRSSGCSGQGLMVHLLHIAHIWVQFNHAGAYEKGCTESAIVCEALMIVAVKFLIVWMFFLSHLNLCALECQEYRPSWLNAKPD